MERTFQFLTDSFAEYYRHNSIASPPAFRGREWGFMFHGETFFRRHLGFKDASQLAAYLVKPRAPAHVYHSSAYYEDPSKHTMIEKGWLGADLIFDLDADHLEGADKMSYAQMLEAVKDKFRRLIDDFLVAEFGYQEKDLLLVFSGSRGYHCHVRDPRVVPLKATMRRQIVDYVTGKVDITELARGEAVAEKFHHAMKSTRISSASGGGWRGKLTRAVVDQLRGIANDNRSPDEKVAFLMEEVGIERPEAKSIVTALSAENRIVESRLASIAMGKADFYKGVGPKSFQALFQYNLDRLKGWCDEPVSSDVKRLIRAPGSLHGKTGLRATPLTRDQLDDFDPLTRAVALDDEPISINVSKPLKVEIAGQAFDLKPGVQKLPRYAAVFTILRRSALLEGDTPPPPPPKAEAKPTAPKAA